MEFMRWVLCAVVGYLLGNIQTGLLIGRLMNNVDLREHGSGSSGATNALRVLGRQSAAFTLLGDFLKGVIAAVLGILIAGHTGGMVAAIFVVVGHIWPVFYGFHGGKGVAASIGVMVTLFPIQSIIMLIIGIAVIYFTKMVSLGSMVGAVAFMIMGIITAITQGNWFTAVFSIVMAALIIFAHRANIGRIRNGTENKISMDMFKKK